MSHEEGFHSRLPAPIYFDTNFPSTPHIASKLLQYNVLLTCRSEKEVSLMSHQSTRRERPQGDTDADGDGASAISWFPAGAALGVAGLATASTAITTCMAISSQSSDPPSVDDSSGGCYLLALSGLFYAGIAELGAAIWVMAEPRGRLAAGRRLVYASLVPLTAAAGLLAPATLFW